MPAPRPVQPVSLLCPCGWRGTQSTATSGLVLECPRCGANLRVPGSGGPDGVDRELMHKLIQGPPAGLPLKPLFAASAVLAVAAVALAVVGNLAFGWPYRPVGIAIIGGGLSWPLGLFVAWLGQRSQRKRRGDG